MAKSLLEASKEAAARQRAAAVAEYIELVRRNSEPRDGDTERFCELVNLLGRSPEDVAGDVEIAGRMNAAERIAATIQRYEDEVGEATEQLQSDADKLAKATHAYRLAMSNHDQALAIKQAARAALARANQAVVALSDGRRELDRRLGVADDRSKRAIAAEPQRVISSGGSGYMTGKQLELAISGVPGVSPRVLLRRAAGPVDPSVISETVGDVAREAIKHRDDRDRPVNVECAVSVVGGYCLYQTAVLPATSVRRVAAAFLRAVGDSDEAARVERESVQAVV